MGSSRWRTRVPANKERRADEKPGPMGRACAAKDFFVLMLFTAFMRSLR